MFYTETMTVLALSEDVNARIKIISEIDDEYSYFNEEDSALYNLIKNTGEELNQLNIKLEEK